MRLTLVREPSAHGATIGRLSVDGVLDCYTCEDVTRPGQPKVPGETAIPEGVYRVVITHSARFKRPLPLLLDVPGFTGIRIHPGNTAGDTEGCILPGLGRLEDRVTHSRIAFENLYSKIRAALAGGEDVWIEIVQQHSPPVA